MTLATRRLQFCAGHRVFQHESKCANMHGHNYVLHFSAEAERGLDAVGRVIDFSVMKEKMEGWINRNWDHGFIYFVHDPEMYALFAGGALVGHKHFALPSNPTAENMARYLLDEVAPVLFQGSGVRVVKIELHETENCSVEVSRGS